MHTADDLQRSGSGGGRILANIDPITDQMLGTTYTISGETNLPAEIELLDKETIPTATQTPGFGLGILAVAFGIAVILGTLRRK